MGQALNRAAETLKHHRVGEIAGKLLNESFKFASTCNVTFDQRVARDYLESSASGVLMGHQGHELVVATTEFRSSAAPDDDSYYADGLVYFDGVLVLRVGATKEYDRYGSTIRFNVYPFSIKSMKAGSWLEALAACYEILESDHRQRATAEKAEKDRKQATEIDLGDY